MREKKVYYVILFASIKHEAIVNIEGCSCVWCRVSFRFDAFVLKFVVFRRFPFFCDTRALKLRPMKSFRLNILLKLEMMKIDRIKFE